jgi:hypothetical protein
MLMFFKQALNPDGIIMNTHQNNLRNIDKLEHTPRLFEDYSEGEVKKELPKKPEQDDAPPLELARKVVVVLTVVLWAVSVFMMIGGGDFTAMLPFLVFMLGMVAALNVPQFWVRKKRVDAIIAGIVATVCILLAITLLSVS